MFEDMSPASDEDPLLKDAINIIRKEGKASVSMLQRKLRIGYTRASRLMDTLEEKGIVAPPEGMSQVRRVIEVEEPKETQTYKSEFSSRRSVGQKGIFNPLISTPATPAT